MKMPWDCYNCSNDYAAWMQWMSTEKCLQRLFITLNANDAYDLFQAMRGLGYDIIKINHSKFTVQLPEVVPVVPKSVDE